MVPYRSEDLHVDNGRACQTWPMKPTAKVVADYGAFPGWIDAPAPFHYVPGYSPFARIVNTTNVQQTTIVTRNSPTYRSGGSWQGYTKGTTSSISASCV